MGRLCKDCIMNIAHLMEQVTLLSRLAFDEDWKLASYTIENIKDIVKRLAEDGCMESKSKQRIDIYIKELQETVEKKQKYGTINTSMHLRTLVLPDIIRETAKVCQIGE